MPEPDEQLCIYGTTEPPEAMRRIEVGPLSFLYSRDALRRISWRGTELVRAVAWPMRDQNWGTYPSTVIDEVLDNTRTGFTAKLSFTVADGDLACELSIAASETGEVRLDLTMTPQAGPFVTNRSGFTVLHPIAGIAGGALTVTHSDGTVEDTVFPRLISPGQPVMDISGLRYASDGNSVDIAFAGEVFEMEDQRNWSDASYKTYCVPLVFPFAYSIEAPASQSIVFTMSGTAEEGRATSLDAGITTIEDDGAAPEVGLAVEPGWIGAATTRDLISKAGASRLLVRLDENADQSFLSACAALSDVSDACVDAEIVVPDGQPAADSLASAAALLSRSGIEPTRVIALPEGYLASHQPSGPWPVGPTPTDVCVDVKTAFPAASVGGGVLTNFTELNRCRPDPAVCDYITHGSTAIVHAGDDMSVLETLEALPQIFESATAIGAGKPYELGLVSIGMRSNPYGADVAENPHQVRRTMARIDPRHRGLFGASWAVGVLASTAGRSVASLCLGAPSGPFGLVYEPQAYPQHGYDQTNAMVYPLYHVHREASRMSGSPRLVISGMPQDVVGYGVRLDGARHLMMANLSTEPRSVTFGEAAAICTLDESSFRAAVSDADWLETNTRQQTETVVLGPFSIAFATLSD